MRVLAAQNREFRIVKRQESPTVLSLLTGEAAYLFMGSIASEAIGVCRQTGH